MTFLNPAILFGLIATSIPILLHFLNLRKLKKVEFSTLIFLKQLQKSKIRRIKIKQWLLLLLRVLIITFIVLAFARPTIKNFSFTNKSANTTAVILVDNTFSMSVVTGSGSYFNKCKQIAKNLINNFNTKDEIAVLPLVNNNEEIKPYTNFDFVKKIIDNLQISYQTNTLNDGIIKAAKILYDSKNLNKELYIITDLQKGRIYNSKKELLNLSELLKNVNIYLIDVHDKEVKNLGIEEFNVNNQIFEKNKTISFSAVVKNYSNMTVNNYVVSLFINGKRSAQQSLSLNPHESQLINFETNLNDTGLIEATAELEDDDINYDNKFYTCFFVPDKINILILTDNNSDSRFIKLALSNQNGNNFQITEKDLSLISSIRLQDFDAVFIIGSDKINDKDKLKNYIENGGSVVLMPGSASSTSSFQNLLKHLEIGISASFKGKINSPDISTQFEKVDLQHPLFEDLFEDKSKIRIESPEIYYYAHILPDIKGKAIISLYDKSAFLSEYKIGLGKILLFNVSPVLSWSNFPVKSLFAPLINKIVFYISSKTKSQQYFYAGDELAVNLQNIKKNFVKVVRPDNSNEIINTDSLINKNFLNYRNTDLTGIYKFFSDDKLIDYFSVNHNPKESSSDYETSDDFEDYLKEISFSNNFINLKLGEDYMRIIYQSRFGVELWKYFLIIALILSIIEMYLSKSSKKNMAKN